MNKKIRLAGLIHESLVNGPGIRRVFFSQGCNHNCEGCFNKETHDFLGGELFDIDELINDIKDNPLIKGVTFSGGDPFEQSDKFAYMAEKLKKMDINIWCYTGYKFEEIIEGKGNNKSSIELLNNIDVLVDGKFEISKAKENLKYRGSDNQRIIDVKKSLKEQKIIEMKI